MDGNYLVIKKMYLGLVFGSPMDFLKVPPEIAKQNLEGGY